ncbi:MAG TPA: transcription termination/antitermination protein NusG, partial [Candidatus Megaira endosymbiont of Hartmannula sinica]|nr:transcription termination/antitermination protein NusG [Candidatus Megaera endosymbiont of Hartmannula sinica]
MKDNLNEKTGFNWYTLHVASNSEKKAKLQIEELIQKHNMQKQFGDIVIPLVKSTELRAGKEVEIERNIMLGYMLINMKMTDESWHLVLSAPKVYNFLGEEKPSPLSKKEVSRLLEQVEIEADKAEKSGIYSIFEQITIIDGPFNSFKGTIDSVNNDNQTVIVTVAIFGKSTKLDSTLPQPSLT